MSLFSSADVAAFRTNRLAPVAAEYFPGVTFDDAYLLGQMQAAEQYVATQLKVLLEPTQIFPYVPSADEISALTGKPWLDEPGYDYDPEFFRAERWGYIVTRQHPIIEVQKIAFAYPAPTTTVFDIPLDWLRLDRRYGHIRMVPATSTFVAPLGAFLLQALGGGSTVPSMLQVKYTAGLCDAKTKWPLVIDVIMKRAVLNILMGTVPTASASISADGLSQSRSLKIADYQDQILMDLFGPKGSNGGLWTAIHGVGGTILGVV